MLQFFFHDERGPYWRARSDQARKKIFRRIIYVCIDIETQEKELYH